LQSLKSFCEPPLDQRVDDISTIRVKNKQKSDYYSFVWTVGTPDLAGSDYTMNPPEKEEIKSETDYIVKGTPGENQILTDASDDKYAFRWMQKSDFDKNINGFQLLNKADFQYKFDQIFPMYESLYKIIVAQDLKTNKIVGSGSLVMELKIHKNCKHAHIEDINMKSGHGKLGQKLVSTLTTLSWHNGCYKCIVGSKQKNTQFFERCGYEL
jgi:hypothetical protein